jgi:hypothetical protein
MAPFPARNAGLLAGAAAMRTSRQFEDERPA